VDMYIGCWQAGSDPIKQGNIVFYIEIGDEKARC